MDLNTLFRFFFGGCFFFLFGPGCGKEKPKADICTDSVRAPVTPLSEESNTIKRVPAANNSSGEM